MQYNIHGFVFKPGKVYKIFPSKQEREFQGLVRYTDKNANILSYPILIQQTILWHFPEKTAVRQFWRLNAMAQKQFAATTHL